MNRRKRSYKVGFITRVKLAWYAFWMKDFQTITHPYLINEELQPFNECDVSRQCPGPLKYCLTRGNLKLSVGFEDDHLHVCEKHANEIIGKESWEWEKP